MAGQSKIYRALANRECGKENSNDHASICQLGGFVIKRHNAVRDLEAELLTNVCKDVVIEPMLQPTSGTDTLPYSVNSEENPRLDVSCRSSGRPLQKSFSDIRITHPNCSPNLKKPLKPILKCNETCKKCNIRLL